DKTRESPLAGAKHVTASWMEQLHGSAEWQAKLHIQHDQLTDISFHSSLRGIASDLPEPFSKKAEDTAPLHFERKAVGTDRDDLRLEYGSLVNAKIERIRVDSGRYELRNGFVNLGSPHTF